jgi:hypothetical protein
MSPRLGYLNTLKVLLVVGVIAMHTAITYGLDGSWYLESYDAMSAGVVDAVTALLGVGWLFGLGLFFLIGGSGRFVHCAGRGSIGLSIATHSTDTPSGIVRSRRSTSRNPNAR